MLPPEKSTVGAGAEGRENRSEDGPTEVLLRVGERDAGSGETLCRERGREDTGSRPKGQPVHGAMATITNSAEANGEQRGERETTNEHQATGGGDSAGISTLNAELLEIYHRVSSAGGYNFERARKRVPSGLRVEEWRRYLADYKDRRLVDYIAYGWPINFRRGEVLQSTLNNHASAQQHGEHIDFYIETEIGYGALLGPFSRPPVAPMHISPLMTRPKRDSNNRRVIVDLSWPEGGAVNEGVDTELYIDGPARISLPTVDYMEQRILQLGHGAFMYKTDLARGYRQLRVDPNDWPLLGFQHRGKTYMDICPPFGLRSAAMCMQRTTEAISYIHAKEGYYSRPYLDDFGGAEAVEERAQAALDALQGGDGEAGSGRGNT